MDQVRVAIVGTGKIALTNHLPGLALAGQARVVALCDSDPKTLEEAARSTGITQTTGDYRSIIGRDDVDAVIVATPNDTHQEIAIAAAVAGKHILCEKPLALDYAGAFSMFGAAEQAGVRHMTAFTYRFVPAMRYLKHLVDAGSLGDPRHFRAQRFQDWGMRGFGWRQIEKLAGSGELADMLSHRIDYAHHLVGEIDRLVAGLRNFIPIRDAKPSDVDDWVAILAGFRGGATGVLESTKLATGRGEGHHGADVVEINGSEATAVYSTQRPLQLLMARRGDDDLKLIDIPREFHVWPGSTRDPAAGDPLVTFRYDQDVEFINAIIERRPCTPSFEDGVKVQAVMDAAMKSAREQRWVNLKEIISGVGA